jgi:glycosyltransferase involved in cell wall biosynthesis
MEETTVKIDLHLHSKFSKRPSEWMLQKIGCAESYSDPLLLYERMLDKGMTFVTLTDHNNIDGGLEIAHLPRTFLSEEVTTYFPEDRCKVHVLTFNISEGQHRDLQHLRENIYELTGYLRQKRITHSLAHPFYSVNGKMTLGHFEKCLLLFKNFELNGSRGKEQNRIIERIVGSLTPEMIDHLGEKHGLVPEMEKPWEKGLTGGSDDHSLLMAGHQYTEVVEAQNLMDFFQGLDKREAKVIGESATPQHLAHTIYSIAYQFYSQKYSLKSQTQKDVFLRLLHRFLTGENEDPGVWSRVYNLWSYRKRKKRRIPENIQEFIRHETQKLLFNDPVLSDIFTSGDFEGGSLESRWFSLVNLISNRAFLHLGNNFLDQLTRGHLFNLFQSLGSIGALYALLSPYFFAFSNFSETRHFSQRVGQGFLKGDPSGSHPNPPAIKVAHFTDTFEQINGVALSLRKQIDLAEKNGKGLMIVTCGPESEMALPGVKTFQPTGCYELPEYPELKMYFPPFLQMLAYCYEERFSHIHTATPGPIGLAALAVARILKIPIYGTYHTALPQYARDLTEDKALEDWMWKFMGWYYNQLDYVYVPSRSTGLELINKGIAADKIRLFFRGVDLEGFHPNHRNGYLKSRYHLGEGFKLLYVGRVSREKNMALLTEAFFRLRRYLPQAHLIVVGDGPYLEEFKEKMKGTPCLCTGYLGGEDLAAVYASCDLFIFPSLTDTFGNVILEAQASGLPVIVTDQGGPRENILPEKTGLIIKGEDPEELVQAVLTLALDPARLKVMGKAARAFMEERSQEEAFLKTWAMYEKMTDPPENLMAEIS